MSMFSKDAPRGLDLSPEGMKQAEAALDKKRKLELAKKNKEALKPQTFAELREQGKKRLEKADERVDSMAKGAAERVKKFFKGTTEKLGKVKALGNKGLELGMMDAGDATRWALDTAKDAAKKTASKGWEAVKQDGRQTIEDGKKIFNSVASGVKEAGLAALGAGALAIEKGLDALDALGERAEKAWDKLQAKTDALIERGKAAFQKWQAERMQRKIEKRFAQLESLLKTYQALNVPAGENKAPLVSPEQKQQNIVERAQSEANLENDQRDAKKENRARDIAAIRKRILERARSEISPVQHLTIETDPAKVAAGRARVAERQQKTADKENPLGIDMTPPTVESPDLVAAMDAETQREKIAAAKNIEVNPAIDAEDPLGINPPAEVDKAA